MATNITLQERTNILKLVAGMFNAAPGAQYLEEFTTAFLALGNDYAALATALGNTPAFKSLYPSSLTVEETANKFLGTLGLANNTEAQDFVQSKLNAGEGIASVVFQALQALVDYAGDNAELQAAQTQLANKATVAEYYSVTLGASSDQLAALQGVVANVTADPASVEAAKEASNSANGDTYLLTKGLDNVPGTAGNDTIIGSVATAAADAELNTFSALDIINGGAGTDTLKVSSTGADIVLGANVTNVEIVEASSTTALDVDTTGSADVTSLKLSAATTITAAAGANTDVSLAAKSTGAVDIEGGKNVTVALTGANDKEALDLAPYEAISIEGASGDVSVSVVGANLTAAKPNVELGTITVTGGKTITVEQRAGNDTALVSLTEGSTQLGKITANADKTTTTITVKQDADQSGQGVVEAVEAVKAVQTVKFKAMAAGDSIEVDGLTFTAAKALTAAQAATAFTQFIALGATQGAGVYTNGTYEGEFNSASTWTAQANGDTVTFTQQEAADFTGPVLNAVFTTAADVDSNLTVTLVTEGVSAVEAQQAEQGINAGDVAVGIEAALTTVNVDGFDDLSIGNGASAEQGAKLATINVANGDDVTVHQAAVELTVNASNIDDLDIFGATKTLNLNLNDADVDVDLNADAITTLNIAGVGSVNADAEDELSALETLKVSGEVNVDIYDTFDSTLKSIDTTANTGKVVIGGIDGESTTYAGGAGVDEVSVTGAKITKSIDLGAGDDTLDLQGMSAAQLALTTVVLEGGEGRDTLALTAADAATLSETAAFGGKINGFEVLSLDHASKAAKVDLANLDNINYVVSANSSAVTENGLVQFQGLTAGQSVTLAGRTVTLSAGTSATATDVAQAFLNGSTGNLTVSGSLSGWTVDAASTGSLTFTSTTSATNVADLATTYADTPLAAATPVAAGTKTDGTTDLDPQLSTPESTAWTMNGLTNGQSYTLAGVTITASKTLTAAEVAAAFANGTDVQGQYEVDGTLSVTGWTTPTFSANGGVLTLTNGVNGDVADFTAAPTGSATGSSPTDAVVSDEYAQGAAVGLTIDNMASGGTLELTNDGAGVIVAVKDAATGTADSFNIVTNADNNDNLGTVSVDKVETISIKAGTVGTNDGEVVTWSNTLTLDADAAKTINVSGAGELNLVLGAETLKVVTAVDASTNTGGVTVSVNGAASAVTVTGGAGDDVITAGSHKDIINAGAGDDTIYLGSNGAVVTGGEGNDTFVLNVGSKEANTYSSITDFQVGDVLKLQGATSFAKLAANLDSATAVFSDYVTAAMGQAKVDAAGAHDAVWFSFNGNSYVVLEQDANAGFSAGVDSIVQLVGVDLTNASYNSAADTVALI